MSCSEIASVLSLLASEAAAAPCLSAAGGRDLSGGEGPPRESGIESGGEDCEAGFLWKKKSRESCVVSERFMTAELPTAARN
jgi:hypothetical protein